MQCLYPLEWRPKSHPGLLELQLGKPKKRVIYKKQTQSAEVLENSRAQGQGSRVPRQPWVPTGKDIGLLLWQPWSKALLWTSDHKASLEDLQMTFRVPSSSVASSTHDYPFSQWSLGQALVCSPKHIFSLFIRSGWSFSIILLSSFNEKLYL